MTLILDGQELATIPKALILSWRIFSRSSNFLFISSESTWKTLAKDLYETKQTNF